MNYYEILGIYNITNNEEEIKFRSMLLGIIIDKYFNNDKKLTNEELIKDLADYYVKTFYNDIKKSMDIIAVGDNTEEETKALVKNLTLSHTMSALRQITGLDTNIIPENYPNLNTEDFKNIKFPKENLKGIVMNNYLLARTKLKNQNSKQEYDKHLKEARTMQAYNDEEVYRVVNEGRFKTYYSNDNNSKVMF